MSQEKKAGAPYSELARTVREIRKRLGINMTEFARKIGVTQGQVSRYESGRALPGPTALGHLLGLAAGTEKNPLLDHLTRTFRGPGPQMTEQKALSELEEYQRRFGALWADAVQKSQRSSPPAPFWAKFLDIAPNLAELLRLVSELYKQRREVDPSLVWMVRLWLAYQDTDPVVRQCFLDAAKYLEFLIGSRTAPRREKDGTANEDLGKEKSA
jgi:transcriptional regulator with XRE-family HTH domain